MASPSSGAWRTERFELAATAHNKKSAAELRRRDALPYGPCPDFWTLQAAKTTRKPDQLIRAIYL